MVCVCIKSEVGGWGCERERKPITSQSVQEMRDFQYSVSNENHTKLNFLYFHLHAYSMQR